MVLVGLTALTFKIAESLTVCGFQRFWWAVDNFLEIRALLYTRFLMRK
jgi:hypothetical protein